MARRKKTPNNPEMELPDPPEMDSEIEDEEEEEEEEIEQDLSALQAAQASADMLDGGNIDADDLFANFGEDEEDGMEWNDPNITHLDPAPTLGGRPKEIDLFGEKATGPTGRSTSPPLYAQVANFPTASRLRVWKIEQGLPVGLGTISAMANEDELVEEFFHAMPKPGERKAQFKLRPIDINGQEMGQEINLLISPHHEALQAKRSAEKYASTYGNDEEEFGGIGGSGDPVSHMSSMFDRMMMTGEQKTRALEAALEAERDHLRRQESTRAEERVSMANEAARGVQVLTERMMADEARRNESSMKMQNEQNQTMVTTLTSIFAQQQQMMQASMEAGRRNDEYRLEQERQRAYRERDEDTARRERERREADERFRREKEEGDVKMRQEREYMERRMMKEHKDMEFRLQREREEATRRHQREAGEREARDRWLAEERGRRDAIEREAATERETERQRRHERMMADMQAAAQRDREHAERMMTLSKIEMSNNAMGGLGELIPKASGFLKTMGVDPSELVQRVLAPPDEGSGTTELITSLLGVAGEVAKTAIASKNPMMPTAPPMLTHTPQMMESPPSPPPGQAAYAMPGPIEQSSPEVQTTPATGAGLSLQDQKKARTTLRKLVQILGTKERGEWNDLIMGTIGAEPAIMEYVQAVTVRAALYEANASDQMVGEIMKGLRDSPLIPHNLAYGD